MGLPGCRLKEGLKGIKGDADLGEGRKGVRGPGGVPVIRSTMWRPKVGEPERGPEVRGPLEVLRYRGERKPPKGRDAEIGGPKVDVK